MGIDFGFACRECGSEVSVHYDTSKSGPESCAALFVATSPESCCLAMSIGRNIGLVGREY